MTVAQNGSFSEVPYEKAVHQFVLDDNSEKYQLLNMYCGEDIATPHLFPNLQINLNEIFEDGFH
jgi:Uma2 family endonuclease